ncbi:MAG TPA: cytochrome c [Thermoanaerobaculia bacterium]|nr:cytochrome c [Thermoanaerobaculia bacterium]
MTMQNTIWLALLMAAIAVVNASLMAWLWRFPMQPDPTGRDPNGVSTAPRFWTNVHRVLGYVFVLTYGALLFEMVPRIWEFRVATASSVLHGAFGIVVGVILIIKIAVIRRFQRFGNRLPWIGGALAASTLIVAALGIVPAWIVMRPLAPLSTELARGRDVVSRKCNQCHGASTIASEREDLRKWERITREMQRFSRKIPGKEPITDDERIAAAAYLAHTLGEDEDHEEEDDDDDGDRVRRGRGRGRGRR